VAFCCRGLFSLTGKPGGSIMGGVAPGLTGSDSVIHLRWKVLFWAAFAAGSFALGTLHRQCPDGWDHLVWALIIVFFVVAGWLLAEYHLLGDGRRLGAAGGSGQGGGGYTGGGSLTLTADTLSANKATGGNGAKAPDADGGAGQGGGVFAAAGTLMLVNDTLAANSVQGGNGGQGGPSNPPGIPGDKGGAGGAGQGGGVAIQAGTATIQSSTIAGSSAGAAHHTAGNKAQGGAAGTGGKGSGAAASVQGGGVWANGGTLVHLKNTLLAINSATSGPDYFGAAKSSDHDLVFDTAGSTGFGLSGSGDVVGMDPHIDGLFANGGPTQTMALLSGSPAINKGDPNTSGDPATDQRGFNRIVGGTIDIGAFEVQTLQDKTSQFVGGVARGGVVHKPNTDLFAQTLTLTNNGPALGGGLLVVLNGLPAHDLLTAAHVGGASGPALTVTGPQPGQSIGYAIFIPPSVLSGLANGQKFSLALTFRLEDPAPFDYTPQVLLDNS
jgi:hypothetical protein